MHEQLIDYFAASTLNQCTHRELPGMVGPEVVLQIEFSAIPYTANTPAQVPFHCQDTVKKQLDNDAAMGVLERVTIGESSKWCH